MQVNFSMPLFAHRRSDGSHTQIGRIEVIGSGTDPKMHDRLIELSELLSELGVELDRIVSNLESTKQRVAPPAPSRLPATAAVAEEKRENEAVLSSSP